MTTATRPAEPLEQRIRRKRRRAELQLAQQVAGRLADTLHAARALAEAQTGPEQCRRVDRLRFVASKLAERLAELVDSPDE